MCMAHGSGQLFSFHSAHVLHWQTPPAHRCFGSSQVELKPRWFCSTAGAATVRLNCARDRPNAIACKLDRIRG